MSRTITATAAIQPSARLPFFFRGFFGSSS